MTKYLGVAGSPVEIFTVEQLDQIYQIAREKIINQLPEAGNDDEFLSFLDSNFKKLKEEVLTTKIPQISPYFLKGQELSRKLLDVSCNQSYKVGGFLSKVEIYQEKLGIPVKMDKNLMTIVMPVSNASERIADVLKSLTKSLKNDRPVLFVISINNTDDNSYQEIKAVLLKTRFSAIINIIPKNSVYVEQPCHNRTVAQNISLLTIDELKIPESSFLVFVEDDIMFPEAGGFEKIIDFMNTHLEYKVVGFNPSCYPQSFLEKIGYSYHPWYYHGLNLMYKTVKDAPIPQPELHGGSFIIRKKDHPVQLPSDLIAQDGWLSNLFTKDGVIGSTRLTGLVMYHHEPTCLSRRLSKIKMRNEAYGIRELWTPFLVDTVKKNIASINEKTYKSWPKNDSSFAILIRTLKP